MHGDREVSTKMLARVLGVKTVTPCSTEKAERVTGYQVGGISPFGTRQPIVCVEASILGLERIYINGGSVGSWSRSHRGPDKVLQLREACVAIEG